MPRQEVIVKNPPGPCTECPKHKTCRETCKKVEDWINQGCRGRNSKHLLANEIWSDNSSVPFVDFELHKNGLSEDDIPQYEPEEALALMRSLKMRPEYIDIIDRRVFQGQRVRDIAIALGLSSQTVSHRFRSAKYSLVRRMRRKTAWDLIQDFDLTDKQRIIAKKYFDELCRIKDIAKECGISDSVVSSSVFKIKQRIYMAMVAEEEKCSDAILSKERPVRAGRPKLDRNVKEKMGKVNVSKLKKLMESPISY